jgi:hypothetical protein
VTALQAHRSGGALSSHYADIEPLHLREEFGADPWRSERLLAAGR